MVRAFGEETLKTKIIIPPGNEGGSSSERRLAKAGEKLGAEPGRFLHCVQTRSSRLDTNCSDKRIQ